MQTLFIDACPRGKDLSRTLRIADTFLDTLEKRHPDMEQNTLCLTKLRLTPYDGEAVAKREALIESGRLDDPIFTLAHKVADADLIVVAASYWDLSFPSMLKVFVEHIFARRVTFFYNERGPVGLCKAANMVYLTTSGSPIGDNNFGAQYLRAVSQMLGVKHFERISAEGLDIDGADVQAILRTAETAARDLAARL